MICFEKSWDVPLTELHCCLDCTANNRAPVNSTNGIPVGGATVVAFEWDGELPVFIVRLANGQRREIAIQQDAEGNGPGFIAGLED